MSRLSTLLFLQSPLPILIADPESLLLSEANPAAGTLLRRDPLSLQGQPLEALCAPGEFARLKDVFSRGAGPHTATLKLTRAGEPFHAELRASLLDGGGEQEWLVFLRDVTSELEAREALRRSEREYRRMVENSPDGIALVQEGLVVFANLACERLLGLASPDELWAAEFESFVHPDDLALWQSRGTKLLEGAPLPRCELRLLRADGKACQVELSQDLIERPEGLAMQVTLRDIGARKKMEDQLRESEERYRGLASVAFDGVAVHFDGVLLQANRSFEAIFGYEDGGSKGLSIFELVIPEQRGYFRRQLDSGEVMELEGLRQDGRHVLIEASTRACSFLGEPAYVTAVRDISARKSAEQALQHQAYYDGLTGLPNRLLFFDRLGVAVEQAARGQGMLAVLLLDLDRFKNVNDSLGHAAGDSVLAEAAKRLGGCLRQGDTLSRLGGDEFTVLLNEVGGADEAAGVAEAMVARLNEPYLFQGQSLSLGASVGLALYPQHGTEPAVLIKHADAAMYAAKDNGRNNVQAYNPGLASPHDKLSMEIRLRQGIEIGEFVLHYQPQHELASGRLAGAEALLRWMHPERGMVMPDEFIPLAEESGLILPLGDWVLRQGCLQAKAWEKAGVRVSINISPWQLHKASLIGTIDAAIKASGVNPWQVELEITETAAMSNPAQTLSMLKDISSRGLSVALDDFGKGYSSLNYLRQFPVSLIKIDMAFIRDLLVEPKDAAIVRAIIVLGHSLGMRVLAEGVENAAQAAFLKKEGCDLAQGYYYSRALPAAEFEKLFAAT
jgi:diguanylate cyclase (GGDEF)-like protein/PAS domain S-box-containing protein